MKGLHFLLLCLLYIGCGNDDYQRDIVDIRISKDKLDLSLYTECIYPVNAIEYNLNYQIRRIFCEYDNNGLPLQETVYTDVEPQNDPKHKKLFNWQNNKLIIRFYDYVDSVEVKTTTITLQF